MVCGLYAGLAVHLSRTQQLARRTEAASRQDMDATGSGDESRDAAAAAAGTGVISSRTALSTRTGYVCFAAALLLGLYQPMLSLWWVWTLRLLFACMAFKS